MGAVFSALAIFAITVVEGIGYVLVSIAEGLANVGLALFNVIAAVICCRSRDPAIAAPTGGRIGGWRRRGVQARMPPENGAGSNDTGPLMSTTTTGTGIGTGMQGGMNLPGTTTGMASTAGGFPSTMTGMQPGATMPGTTMAGGNTVAPGMQTGMGGGGMATTQYLHYPTAGGGSVVVI